MKAAIDSNVTSCSPELFISRSVGSDLGLNHVRTIYEGERLSLLAVLKYASDYRVIKGV